MEGVGVGVDGMVSTMVGAGREDFRTVLGFCLAGLNVMELKLWLEF